MSDGHAGPERVLDDLLAALRRGESDGAQALWDALTPRARTRLVVAGGPAGEAPVLVSLRRTAAGWRVTGLRRDDLPWS